MRRAMPMLTREERREYLTALGFDFRPRVHRRQHCEEEARVRLRLARLLKRLRASARQSAVLFPTAITFASRALASDRTIDRVRRVAI